MFLFVEKNKGFLFLRDWGIFTQIKREIVRLTSKLTKNVSITSIFSNANVKTKITYILNNSSKINIFAKIKSTIMETINLASKISKLIEIKTFIKANINSFSKITFNLYLKSKLTKIINIFTKIKKHGE